MRKLLSRVEDVFQIAERGCVVCPGIPRNSESRLKIGDRLWLERPDGSEVSTIVRGVEMNGPINSPGIPILLGAEITEHEVPVGTRMTVDFTPTETFTLLAKANADRLDVDRTFERDKKGYLHFGWSGRSRSIATTTDIQNCPIEFTDYLMEGFVSYHMQAIIGGQTLTVIVSLHGTNRDQHLRSHVTFHLRQAGLTVGE